MMNISAFAQEFKYHTVKKGETVYSISKDYNVSEEDIYKYNPDSIKWLMLSFLLNLINWLRILKKQSENYKIT